MGAGIYLTFVVDVRGKWFLCLLTKSKGGYSMTVPLGAHPMGLPLAEVYQPAWIVDLFQGGKSCILCCYDS